MNQLAQNAQDTETPGQHAGIRLAELIDQNWSRNKSTRLAMRESISLTEQHRNVIDYLRKQYLKNGLPGFASTAARALNRLFDARGGSKYLNAITAR